MSSRLVSINQFSIVRYTLETRFGDGWSSRLWLMDALDYAGDFSSLFIEERRSVISDAGWPH